MPDDPEPFVLSPLEALYLGAERCPSDGNLCYGWEIRIPPPLPIGGGTSRFGAVHWERTSADLAKWRAGKWRKDEP